MMLRWILQKASSSSVDNQFMSAGHRLRIIGVGLAGVVGAVGGALLGFYLAPRLFEPTQLGDSMIANLFEFLGAIVIAGWVATIGAILGWLLIPIVLRALMGWPHQGRSLGFQLLDGLILWPALVLLALATVDLPSAVTLGLALSLTFAMSAAGEMLAINRTA